VRETLLQHLIAPGSAPLPRPLILECFAHEAGHVIDGVLHDGAGQWWWVAAGVPRLLSPSMYRNPQLQAQYGDKLRRLGLRVPAATRGGARLDRVQARTIDRFGHEWQVFKAWGYHDEGVVGDDPAFRGGRWADTLAAFRSKTFLDGLIDGAVCLDAGCGNGRFCAAALAGGAAEVIGVDIGWGVDAAFDRHRDNPRIHIVQASLFDLPVTRVDAAFSIGVLMHTGDAARAFRSVAGAVVPGGLLAVRLYHRGNWAYEVVDRSIRTLTTRLGKGGQMRFAQAMARLGRRLDGPSRLRWYRILRNWPTVHHNLDWWTAPVASHHTSAEVAGWGRAAGLELIRADPPAAPARYGFWEWPEALTVLFERPVAVAPERVPSSWRETFAGVASG
jgi:SAM-dependent methyltransferase